MKQFTHKSSIYTLREAKIDDLSTIIDLLFDDDLGNKRECTDLQAMMSYRTAFFNIENDPNNEICVFLEENNIAGCLQITYIQCLTFTGAVRAQIESVRISKNKRNTGLGSIMFKLAFERIAKRGCSIVQLTTDKQRINAIHFYEKLGFTASHEGMKMKLILDTHGEVNHDS